MREVLKAELPGKDEAEYGDLYKPHVLELYKLHVEMADRLGARRQVANTFFLSINTVLVSFLGIFTARQGASSQKLWLVPVAAAGLTIAYFWLRLVRSYGQMGTVRYQLIQTIESQLPLRMYKAEWDAVGRGERPEGYTSITAVEAYVPVVFALLYIALATWTVVSSVSG